MTGRLSVIVGCMFSGKTEELIRQATRPKFAGRKVQIFKPALDNRWQKFTKVCAHSGNEHKATPIKTSHQILKKIKPNTQVVAIDEAQFLDDQIVPVIKKLLARDIQVIIAGLNLDFRGEPFAAMPQLLALADQVTQLYAICNYEENGQVCGDEKATRTQRLINGQPADYKDPIILVGAQEAYAARCVNHHLVPGKPSLKF